jgi:hypothetical protein
LISDRTTTHSLFWKLCAIALLALLGWVLCSRISHPWTYNDDYNGAFWAQAARNLAANGVLRTAGVPAPLYFGQPPAPEDALYVHHPTLLAEMMLLDRMLLGESESAARALPIFFSVLTAALLWLVTARAQGWRGAAFVLAFFVAAPMELHYGQMVNFEAPELFFLLGALGCFHLWREGRSKVSVIGLAVCCVLAMWTDWQGYLLVILLAARLIAGGSRADGKIAGGLLLAAFFSGLAFLLQIRMAAPGAWQELFSAFRERSGHGDLSGGSFTAAQWLRTEYIYLTTLYHPAAWLLAAAGAVMAYLQRRRLTRREAAPLEIGAVLFVIDAIYVCVLRNQSFIHDFASFYFLVPIAVSAGFLVESSIRAARAGPPAFAVTLAGCAIAAGLIAWGVHSLDHIDTQFCILDDDDSEPAMLMPDLGGLIDRTFPPDAVVLCNFDRYYSPLPYYARRAMANDTDTYADWQRAISDALPQPAGGIVWTGAPDAAELLAHLPAAEKRPVTVDGIPFVLWTPAGKATAR